MRSPILAAAIMAILPLLALAQSPTAPAVTTTAATEPTAQEREADFYRQIYARYKAQIINDAKAADTAALTRTTHAFNESLGGNLLLVQVSRVDGEGKYTSVLNLTLNPDKPAKLDKIHHGTHDKVEVTNVNGEIQIETNHLPWDLKTPGKLPQYEDDVYITMCLAPLPAATQPAPAATTTGTPGPGK